VAVVVTTCVEALELVEAEEVDGVDERDALADVVADVVAGTVVDETLLVLLKITLVPSTDTVAPIPGPRTDDSSDAVTNGALEVVMAGFEYV